MTEDKSSTNFYTIMKASKLFGLSEQFIREAIKEGRVKAKYADSLGDFLVDVDSIKRFLSTTQKLKANKTPVLIIDCDPQFLMNLKLELGRQQQLDVKTCTCSADAVSLCVKYKPRVILIRHKPSEAEAMEMLRNIRAKWDFTGCKVIIFTSGVRDRTELKAELAKDYPVVEVFDQLQFRFIIAKAIELSKSKE